MTKRFLFPFSISIACSIASTFASAASTDEDGCYKARDYCISMTSKWKGDRFVSYFENVCNDRLYVKFCNKKNNGRYECGADGIRPGQRKSWSTYNATGDYSAKWVGSTKSSSDWVCSSKVSGWNDDD